MIRGLRRAEIAGQHEPGANAVTIAA